MNTLETLKDKVDLLLTKFATTEAENKRLKTTIANQNETIEVLNKKVATLEQNSMGINIDKIGMDEHEKENMRLQLDTVISEIDKILVTLND